jgi:hypothetical protein
MFFKKRGTLNLAILGHFKEKCENAAGKPHGETLEDFANAIRASVADSSEISNILKLSKGKVMRTVEWNGWEFDYVISVDTV